MSRSDRVAKRRDEMEKRLGAATTQRERAAVYSAWVHAALVNMPASPDGAARTTANAAVGDLIQELEALERDTARVMAQVGAAS